MTKLSAKTMTATFLAAMALGAACLANGCTVNSTSSTDTDGGGSSSGGSSGTTSSSGATSSSGTVSEAGAQCTDNTNQTSKFATPNYGAGCQACLEAKCCDKLKGCFGQTPKDADGGALPDCNDYKACIDNCNTQHPLQDDGGAPPELATCYDDCDSAVNGTQAEAVRVSFELLTDSCIADTSVCGTECAAP